MKQSFKFLIAFSLFFGSFSYATYASNALDAPKANKKESGVTGENVKKTFERSPRTRPGRGVSPSRNSNSNRREEHSSPEIKTFF